jgi:hypothetical protein
MKKKAGREKQSKKEKKRKRKDGSSNRRVPDALSGFVCDLHSQTPDPSVFLFDVSHIDAVPLVQSCHIRHLPFGIFAGSLEAWTVAHEATKHSAQ